MSSESPLRVCHIIAGLDTGGAEMMLYKLVSHCDRTVIEPVVLSLAGYGTIGPRIAAAGVQVHDLASAQRPGLGVYGRLASMLREMRPDVVHGWMYRGNLAASLGCFLGRVPAPAIWSIRATLEDLSVVKPATRLLIRAGAVFARSSRRILFNSHAAADRHDRLGYPRDLAQVIPNGFDTTTFTISEQRRAAARARLGIGEHTFVVGHVARFDPLKDHDCMLRAFTVLARQDMTSTLVMAGPGISYENSALARTVREQGLESRVLLIGACDDVAGLMPAFDIAASSSITEGFPNVVGEAMACGVPCVVTDVGDSRWIVGTTGRVVPASDPKALGAALLDLRNLTAQDRRRLGSSARARITDEFSIDHVARTYEALYRDVVPSSVANSVVRPARQGV